MESSPLQSLSLRKGQPPAKRGHDEIADSPEYWFQHHNTELWRPFFEREGYCVLIDALTPKETSDGVSLFYSWLESVSPNFQRQERDTFINANWPLSFSRGMVMEGGIQHSPFMWYSRTRNGVLNVYKHLYGIGHDEPLLVSFDRCTALRNDPKVLKKLETEDWLHIDYPLGKQPTFQSYQSFINYVDCSDATAPCLRVLPRSHTKIPMMQQLNMKEKPIGDTELAQLELLRENLVEVKAPAGALVIWKCGLIHDGKTATQVRQDVGNLRRLVSYVSYAPSNVASAEDIKKRREYFRNGTCTGHWVGQNLSYLRGPPRPRSQYPSLVPLVRQDHSLDDLVNRFGNIVKEMIPM
jgi:hypothetical protein